MIYANFLAGTITDAPLTAGATTVNSAGFANLPAVASDTLRLVLDPDADNGAPEVIYVSAHTSSATSVTVSRGQEGTTAREHAVSSVWRHTLTKADADNWQAITEDGAVDTVNLADESVTTAKLDGDAVTGGKIADDAVDSEHIANGAIDLAHMSADSVDSDQYVDGSIDTVHLADGSVTEDKLDSDVLSSAFTNVTLVNGWGNVTGRKALQYRKVGDQVTLYGSIQDGTNTTVGTLPAGFRPSTGVEASVHAPAFDNPSVVVGTGGAIVVSSTAGAAHINMVFQAA